jgi:hypothetical protein
MDVLGLSSVLTSLSSPIFILIPIFHIDPSIRKVRVILEVLIPEELFATKRVLLVFAQKYKPAPVCVYCVYDVCVNVRIVFGFAQADRSMWPEEQRCQFDAVATHRDRVSAWIPDASVPLSQSIHLIDEFKEQLYSAPLWIRRWDDLVHMGDARRMIVTFKLQPLSQLLFPWMSLDRAVAEEQQEEEEDSA